MDEYDFSEAGIHGPDVDELWTGIIWDLSNHDRKV